MSFHYESDKVKGKLNKLKIGQKVQAKPCLVDWFTSHLSWSYGRCVPEDKAYEKGQKEIPIESLHKIYAWCGVKLSGKMPTGTIGHYGADDNDDGIKRKNVWVEFIFKTELGTFVEGNYVEEKNLTAVKKRKKKK